MTRTNLRTDLHDRQEDFKGDPVVGPVLVDQLLDLWLGRILSESTHYIASITNSSEGKSELQCKPTLRPRRPSLSGCKKQLWLTNLWDRYFPVATLVIQQEGLLKYRRVRPFFFEIMTRQKIRPTKWPNNQRTTDRPVHRKVKHPITRIKLMLRFVISNPILKMNTWNSAIWSSLILDILAILKHPLVQDFGTCSYDAKL